MELMRLEALFWSTARGRLDARAVAAAFRSDARLDAVARMAIYRDMYFARQLAALDETFPKLAQELGAQAFRGLAREYLHAHPSQAPAIEWIGRRFAEFVRAHAPCAAGSRSDLADLAQLEWLACAAQLAPDEPVVELPALSPDDWPRAQLVLSGAIGAASVTPRTYAAWSGDAAAGAERIDVAVFRDGWRVRHVVLDADEARALALALQGQRFEAVCGALPDAGRALAVVRSWLARRWIVAVAVP